MSDAAQETRTDERYWRSLDRLLDSPGVAAEVRRAVELSALPDDPPDFPAGASAPPDGITRRSMLGLMGASFGLAGLTACRRPVEHIVPYVEAPEGRLPGIAARYASTMMLGTSAYGVVVESHEGRPTKIEGNELHPSSGGAASAWMQAALLDLYDPHRGRTVLRRPGAATAGAAAEPVPPGEVPAEPEEALAADGEGDGADEGAALPAAEPATWEDFAAFWTERATAAAADGGARLAVLSGGFSSPTLARLARRFRERYPGARWVAWEPAGDGNAFAGIEQATGAAQRPVYHLEAADVVLALDSDLLLTESEALANARGFARGRKPDGRMNRLYAVESAMSLTGANADHRVRLPSSQIAAFAGALAAHLGAGGGGAAGEAALPAQVRARLALIADDLRTAGSAALVVAGRRQPPAVHALAHRINQALGAVGTTVTLEPLADVAWGRPGDLAGLTRAMAGGEIETLVVLGGNPAHDAPGELGFAAALARVPHVVRLGPRPDETAAAAEWYLPESHFLEAWGDARAADGTASVVQPLIAPLFDTRSACEVLALMTGEADAAGHRLVLATWGAAAAEAPAAPATAAAVEAPDASEDGSVPPAPETNGAVTAATPTVAPAAGGSPWLRTLHDGVAAAGTGPAPILLGAGAAASPTPAPRAAETAAGALELVFLVSPTTYDGRFAHNAWLQEQPDPLTRLSWANAVLVSTTTAGELGLATGDVVRLAVDGRTLEAPVWIAPGQADGSLALEIGYGRSAGGRVGEGVGVNASVLRGAGEAGFVRGVTLEPTGGRADLPQTQEHWSMEGRDLVREADVEHYREHPDFAHHVHGPALENLWEGHSYGEGYQWGMTIDLASCIGCNACVAACQAENNIPVVGPEQVARGREMLWLRVDRYYAGDPEDPQVVFQTVPCMHCENAPCEQVCPVAATVHDGEGLNAMVYNRCIGTRYCSNNCPYKVRRFNFFNYTKDTPELTQMAMNPDVTVRSRGVMEKCTYCVQRINRGKKAAKLEGRLVADGEIKTACQQTCPVEAITFGNIADPESAVSQEKAGLRNYALLAELNNRPRTTYLAKVRNPNPRWAGGAA